jgi:NAD(P)-dependent dehydrogenase (short-subunit alcohol dehydrogenase family)
LQDVDHIDWVVCAHGFIDTETVLEEVQPENIEATFAINAFSIFYLAQQFLRHMPAGGGMIAISSSAGIQANGRMAAYSASKAAVNSFIQAMARNRPEQKFFAVCPGPTNTAMRERVAGDAAKMQSPDVVAKVVADLVTGTTDNKSGDVILVKDGAISTFNSI